MRRALFLASLIAAAVAAAAPATADVSARTKHSWVSVADCHPSDLLAQRYASFDGQMKALSGTSRMAMRFTLFQRLPGAGSFEPVVLPELRPWRRSKPGSRVFIYSQRVIALRDGSAYRMRVQFRWYGAHGKTQRTAVSHSGVCRQPAPLPNLTIGSISAAKSGSHGTRTYSITLANTGGGEARKVGVALKVDGLLAGTARVDLLPAQEQAVVQIDGPPCAFTVRAVADPQHRIAETNESDNALAVPCAQANA